jgi:hypothetical protein
MTSHTDVKELIPELFISSNLSIFQSDLPLATRKNGKIVKDVKLPPWADSPLDFIQKHRAALECKEVSDHLHLWIDLVFGIK